MMTLRPYQKDIIDSFWAWFKNPAHEGQNPCIVAPTGCHAKGQGILMADGTIKAVETIQVGDHVMGGDGTPRTVTALHHGVDRMYRVVPVKGTPFVVNGGHILSLTLTCHEPNRPTVVNISVNDYLVQNGWFKHVYKLYRSQVRRFERKEEDLLIPPYILGVLIGDGSLCHQTNVTKNDPEIINAIAEYAKTIGCTTRLGRNSSGCMTVFFKNATPNTRIPSPIKVLLQQVGLWDKHAEDKFIPDAYKYGSEETRKEILAGLLDTDGSVSRNTFDYISKSKQLASDLAFVARSLGLSATLRSCVKSCQGGYSNTYWRVCISGDTAILPLRIGRKRAAERKQKKRCNITGFAIEEAGEGEYIGFECDGDHLYMLDDFTVTHNSGKSVIISSIIKDSLSNWPTTRILLLTHQLELVVQDYNKLMAVYPDIPAGVGIYCAKAGQKNIQQVTFASLQSIAHVIDSFPKVDLVIIDEVHRVNNTQSGNYRKVLDKLKRKQPGMIVVGFTATPYRLGQGYVYEGKDAIFSPDLIEPKSATILQLVKDGYLCPLRSKFTDIRQDVNGVEKSNTGEYNIKDLAAHIDKPEDNEKIVDEIIERGAKRRHWLIFCVSIAHAHHIADLLNQKGIPTACVTGDTKTDVRNRMLEDYKAGKYRAMTNVDVLSTGFDFPAIDLIAMLRPTMSPGLYCQAVGRGLRTSPEKKDCMVLDFAGNIMRHGPITQLNPPHKKGERKTQGTVPMKVCPQCSEIVPIQTRVCPSCGYEWPKTDRSSLSLHNDDIMGLDGANRLQVTGWSWYATTSKRANPMIYVSFATDLRKAAASDIMVFTPNTYASRRSYEKLKDYADHCGVPVFPDEDFWDVKVLQNIAFAFNRANPPRRVEWAWDLKRKYKNVTAVEW